MNIENVIAVVFNGIISIYINCLFFEIFSPKKEIRGRRIIIVLLTVVFILSLLLQISKAVNFITLLAVVLVLSCLYNTKWYIRAFLTFAIILLSSFAELIVAILISEIFNVSLETLKTGYYFIIGSLASKLISFIITAIIRFGKYSLPLRKLWGLWLYVSMLPLASVIMLFVISEYIFIIEDRPLMQLITMIGMFLLIGINILVFYVINKICDYYTVRQDLIVANELIEGQRKSYRSLFDSQTEIKKVRHDLKNVLIGVMHELEVNNIDSAKEYLRTCYGTLENNTNTIVSGNSIVDTLLFAKKQIAKDKGICLDADLDLTQQINIDAIDFSVLLGNAIDNAIEATENISGDPSIRIKVIVKSSTIFVYVKNPVIKPVDVNKLFSTKSDKQNHGFGILQMNKLAEKYQGQVFLDCDSNEFTITIVLSNDFDT